MPKPTSYLKPACRQAWLATCNLLLVPFYFLLATCSSAFDLTATESAKVTATVPITSSPSQDLDTTKPTIPILISPPDGTLTNQSLPTFIWQRSQDPNGNYVVYNLYLNGVATYLDINNTQNSLTTLYATQILDNTIHLTPTDKLIDGIYEWKVTAQDLAGNEQKSALWRLTVDTLSPPLSLITLQNNSNPDLTSDFKFPGPDSILFVFQTESGSLVTLTLLDTTKGLTHTLSQLANDQGLARFQPLLEIGRYEVFAFSQDKAGNQTTLNPFFIGIHEQGTLPPQPSGTTQLFHDLPATVALTATRVFSATNLALLLAVAVACLLIARRRHNLTLYSTMSQEPLAHADLTHQHKDQYQELTTSKHGRAYVNELNHGSYLLITHPTLPLPISLCLRSPKLPLTLYL